MAGEAIGLEAIELAGTGPERPGGIRKIVTDIGRKALGHISPHQASVVARRVTGVESRDVVDVAAFSSSI